MKKIISIMVALFFIISAMESVAPKADALGAVWVKKYYNDKFGDPTEDYYLINKQAIVGTFNSKSVKNGKLYADLIIDMDMISFVLYENKTDLVYNNGNSPIDYTVFIKDSTGDQSESHATMPANADRVYFEDGESLVDALCAGGTEVKVYLECEKTSTEYQFNLKCGNFNKIFQEEIQTPINEKKYQNAIELLENKQFDDAKEIFVELKDFKDSSNKVLEVEEAKNSEAYSQAEELLSQGQYDAAKEAFIALGTYGDSASKVLEVEETKNAAAYSQAVELLSQGQFDAAKEAFIALGTYGDSASKVLEVEEAKNAAAYVKAGLFLNNGDFDDAIVAYESLGEYRDSAERVVEAVEAKNADAYERAEKLLEEKQFDEAIMAFEALGNYRDSKQRVSETAEAKNLDAYDRAEKLLKAKRFDDALATFETLGDFRDSEHRVIEVIEAKKADTYEKAGRFMLDKQFDEAIETFKSLGTYRDSVSRMEEAIEAKNNDSYDRAKALIEVQEYGKAYDILITIREFSDVQNLLETNKGLLTEAHSRKIAPFMNIGDEVTFGKYNKEITWIILDSNGDTRFLLSKEAVDAKPYNQDFNWNGITWGSCSLRKWLNSEFYNEAFSDEEKSAIITTYVDNSTKASVESEYQGSGNTSDKVFLLSSGEVNTYFKRDNGLWRDAVAYYKNSTCEWWLRCGGFSPEVVQSNGQLSHGAQDLNRAVRPAIWVDLNSKYFW